MGREGIGRVPGRVILLQFRDLRPGGSDVLDIRPTLRCEGGKKERREWKADGAHVGQEEGWVVGA